MNCPNKKCDGKLSFVYCTAFYSREYGFCGWGKCDEFRGIKAEFICSKCKKIKHMDWDISELETIVEEHIKNDLL